MITSVMPANTFKLYNLFRKDLQLSDAKAQEAVEVLEEVFQQKLTTARDDAFEKLATKVELTDAFNSLDKKIDLVRTELLQKITNTSIIQVIATVAAIFGIMKYLQ